MNQTQIEVIQKCAADSAAGKTSFGQIVLRLMEAGIERYHSDYSRHENTFYLPNGDSLVVPMPRLSEQPIAPAFTASIVEQSVRQSQRGEIFYPQFVQQTMAAGCVGYFVQITGRRVQYFGRNGEIHVELFPS